MNITHKDLTRKLQTLLLIIPHSYHFNKVWILSLLEHWNIFIFINIILYQTDTLVLFLQIFEIILSLLDQNKLGFPESKHKYYLELDYAHSVASESK